MRLGEGGGARAAREVEMEAEAVVLLRLFVANGIRVGRRRVVVGVAVLNGKCGKPCVRLTAHHPHVESGEEGGLNAHQRALFIANRQAH